MTNTHAIAASLHSLAETLESQPALESPYLFVNIRCDDKATFAKLARLLPKPLKKHVGSGEYADVRLERESESLHFWLTIPRNRICRKVQDAVWECDPIFEEGELEALAAGGL